MRKSLKIWVVDFGGEVGISAGGGAASSDEVSPLREWVQQRGMDGNLMENFRATSQVFMGRAAFLFRIL
jgi:hypothetical protein